MFSKRFMQSFILSILCSLSLYAETKILAFSGSTREESCNKKLIKEAAQIARQAGAIITVIDLKEYPIPFYDADLEKNQGMPENAKKIRKLMMESQAIIISSPEYNGSLPAVLKNVIDWTSRSESGQPSREAFAGKKFAIMSCSPGQTGGARGLVHLRSIIQDIGGVVIVKQVVVPNSYSAFTSQGLLENPNLKKELNQEIEELLKK